MAKISLHVNDKKLDTLLTILENLKEGLIENIEIEKKKSYNKPKQISKEPLEPVSINTKYVDPKTFKERLKRMKNAK